MADEVIDGSDCFHAGEPTACHHAGEQRPANVGAALGVGYLKQCDQPVTQVNRVPQGLHSQRVRLESWDVVEVRYGTEPNNQVVVIKLVVMMVEAVRYVDLFPFQVNGLNFTGEEVHPLEQLSHRTDDVGYIQIAGCYFVQHWAEEKKVLPVYQGDFCLSGCFRKADAGIGSARQGRRL